MPRTRSPLALHNKVAVVTGACSGIGRAIAELLAREGARVHGADIDPGAAHVVDVSDAAAVCRLADDVFAAEGRVDLLFNNAGIAIGGEVEKMPLEDWRRIVDVNLMGVVHGVHAFLPRMLEQPGGGHIVNTASMAGLIANPGLTAYATTKFAVVGLSESLDLEVADRGVRVTALCPGIINTPIVDSAVLYGGYADRQARFSRLYKSRGTSPDVVAAAALDAVSRGRVIAVTPRYQVMPAWLLKRYAPPAGRALTRTIARLANR